MRVGNDSARQLNSTIEAVLHAALQPSWRALIRKANGAHARTGGGAGRSGHYRVIEIEYCIMVLSSA